MMCIFNYFNRKLTRIFSIEIFFFSIFLLISLVSKFTNQMHFLSLWFNVGGENFPQVFFSVIKKRFFHFYSFLANLRSELCLCVREIIL